MCKFLIDLGTGVLSGIIFAGLVYLFQQGRYCYFLKRVYNGGLFDCYYKERPDVKIRTITLLTRGQIISYSGEHIFKDSGEGCFSGEIIINPINLKIGEGVHTHPGGEGFNFPKVYLKDRNTIYVEDSYCSARENEEKFWEFKRYHQAYIWRRSS